MESYNQIQDQQSYRFVSLQFAGSPRKKFEDKA